MNKAQFDLFASHEEVSPSGPQSFKPDPERIRVKLAAVLDQIRRADSMPWDSKTLRFHQTTLPQMTSVLPETEAEVIRAEFAEQLQRLSSS